MTNAGDLLEKIGIVVSAELKHHGVKGMKWGVRRRSGGKGPSSAAVQKVNRPKNTLANRPGNRRASDAELRAAVNRLQLEKQYRELTIQPKTKTFVRQLLEDSAKDAARTVARKAVSAGVELALGKAAAKATGNNKEFLELMVGGKKKKKD